MCSMTLVMGLHPYNLYTLFHMKIFQITCYFEIDHQSLKIAFPRLQLWELQ